jgi:hypothetical protein
LANSAGLNPTSPAIKPLSERMRETLRRFHYSHRTEESYLMWCRQFVAFHGGRSPINLNPAVGIEPKRTSEHARSKFPGLTL